MHSKQYIFDNGSEFSFLQDCFPTKAGEPSLTYFTYN